MRAAQLMVTVLLIAGASTAFGACTDASSEDAAPHGDGDGGPDGTRPGDDVDGGATDGAATGDAQIREDGGPTSDAAQGQDASSPKTGASCAGLAMTCGGSKDCCASNVVAGGTFKRSDDPAF